MRNPVFSECVIPDYVIPPRCASAPRLHGTPDQSPPPCRELCMDHHHAYFTPPFFSLLFKRNGASRAFPLPCWREPRVESHLCFLSRPPSSIWIPAARICAQDIYLCCECRRAFAQCARVFPVTPLMCSTPRCWNICARTPDVYHHLPVSALLIGATAVTHTSPRCDTRDAAKRIGSALLVFLITSANPFALQVLCVAPLRSNQPTAN